MFGFTQQLDISCLHVLASVKTANIGVSVSLFGVGTGLIRNLDGQNVVETLNIEHKHNRKPYRKVHKLGQEKRSLFAKPRNQGPRKRVEVCGNLELNEKNKLSGKWVSYGGCIPSILQALDTIDDIDEALKPWEESLNKKERSIILKEQSEWVRALEIFKWFKQKGCYELNVIHYNILLRILGKAQRWDELESIWVDMEREKITPTNSTYGTLIDVYSKGGLKEKALCWLDKMNTQGLEPDEVTMGIVVQTYKKAGEFKRAEQFFKEWSGSKLVVDQGTTKPDDISQPQKCYSSYTYNTLIDTYGKASQLKQASETFAKMLREGIVPNTVTFNTMIHICGTHGHFEEVEALMVKMEELRCPPDTRTYNILISLHARNDNINEAANYFRKMKLDGLQPDPVGYRTLLYAFSIRNLIEETEALVLEMDERGLEIDESTQTALTRMYINAGFPERSWSWFERYHQSGKMSSECYSANIDAFGERGYLLLAEKAFSCCLGRKNLSALEFNVMIKAYGLHKKYDKASKLFDSMETYGVSPDKCTYNTLIQFLSGADLPYQAKYYVRKMQEAGLVQDCIPYCAVISSFAKIGELGVVEELFQELVGHGVKPDIVMFGILINTSADTGSVKEATNYVKAMKAAGFSGNSVIYNSLIKLYTKVGYVQEAQDTYKLLRLTREGPDVYTSNCMIQLYTERSLVKGAEEIFADLKRRGDANEFSFAKMLCMYKKIGRFKEAVGIAHEMNKRRLLTDVLSFNNVIGLFVSDGRLKEATEFFHQMISLGIQPDDSTFRSLGTLLVRCGVSKKVVNKMQIERRKNSQSGIQAWVAILCAMVGMVNDVAISCELKHSFGVSPAEDIKLRYQHKFPGVQVGESSNGQCELALGGETSVERYVLVPKGG